MLPDVVLLLLAVVLIAGCCRCVIAAGRGVIAAGH